MQKRCVASTVLLMAVLIPATLTRAQTSQPEQSAGNDQSSPRYGYSIGKWVDDATLVVDTVGTDERTWIDNSGRPHSDELRVEERFHRVNHDLLELTVTITDPKIYTKPWLALDKFPMKLQPADFDIREMICSPSELADYLKTVGNPEGGPTGEAYPFRGGE